LFNVFKHSRRQWRKQIAITYTAYTLLFNLGRNVLTRENKRSVFCLVKQHMSVLFLLS
jgi:hypothetical protein